MEEEIKKRGRGRPRKGEIVPKPKKKRKRTSELWGGAREGAGRKTAYEDGTLSAQVTLRVREITKRRMQQLRELTKGDEQPFNRMFEAWVEELAQNYGLE